MIFGKKVLAACVGALFALASVAAKDDSSLVILDDTNFDKIIDGSKPAFVKFYAPWCGHCKAMAEDYSALANAYAYAKDDVIIAKLDADEYRSLGKRFDIKGFPTLKWFPKGETKDPEDYTGGRSIEALTGFVKEKTGNLTYEKFDKVALNPEKHVLVEFYAPWCGHCKNLAPTYAKLAEVFANEPNVVIANYDASEDKRIQEKVDIAGFPTIYLFPAGDNTKPIEFDGADRSLETLVQFVNTHAGTKRSPEGTLDPTAGRIASLDAIARRYLEATNNERKNLIGRAKKIAQDISDNTQAQFAKYYIKVMEKANDASDFITKESKRLYNIVSQGRLAPSNLDNFSIRQNILNVFSGKAKEVEKKIEDTKEKVGEKVEDTKAKVGEKVEDTKAKVGEKVEDTKAKVGEKVEDTKAKVGEKVKDTKGKVEQKVKDTKEKVEEVKDEL
ncbi:hypothetical protein EV182_001804 [Spiromyces aspiralis]|uniref:Uncharacterized protein n=1 Tax=Spiromyces aspiralis TaxID=68401 RepID=A0ACC1HIW5_9FUNG|nr:hypothetical protein EV182_001804 [Spiromyces aspiralis]